MKDHGFFHQLVTFTIKQYLKIDIAKRLRWHEYKLAYNAAQLTK